MDLFVDVLLAQKIGLCSSSIPKDKDLGIACC